MIVSKKHAQKELTGRHVLAMLLLFFGVMIAVNIYFGYTAVKTFTGEDVKKSYRQGLDYNTVIQSRVAQSDLGWAVRANSMALEDGQTQIIVKIENEKGIGQTDLTITGTLHHRVDSRLDLPLMFQDQGGGQFAAQTIVPMGQYVLKAVANSDQMPFKFQYNIVVK